MPDEKQNVRIVEKKGESALVQHESDGKQRRVFVPVAEVVDGKCRSDVLDMGIPYGIDWERRLDLSTITAEVVAARLRHYGIWTMDDLKLMDRKTIKIGVDLIGGVIWAAAKRDSK